MIRRPRALALGVALATAGPAAAVAPARAAAATPSKTAAGWGAPFQLAKPGTLDAQPVQLAFAPSGAAAAAFSRLDVDTPGTEQAWLATRAAGGRVGGPLQLGGARQVLALSYSGRTLQMLVGSSPKGVDCCSTAEAVRVSASGKPGAARAIVGGLTGPTTGRLLTLGDGRMLAAIATARGVWVSQSARGGRLGKGRTISTKGQEPTAMDAAWLGAERSIVAWTATKGLLTTGQPRTIDISQGTRAGAPRRAHAAITIRRGHRVDELAVARRAGGATLTWIETWYDGKGRYRSQVKSADLAKNGKAGRPRSLSGTDRVVSGLTVGSDAAGDQGVAWQSCTAGGACTVQAVGRPGGQGFGHTRRLGQTDNTEPPSLGISPSGQTVIGWVRGGHPVASVGFGRPAVLSKTPYATAVDAAYGPKHVAIVAWTENTLHPAVVGAAYKAR